MSKYFRSRCLSFALVLGWASVACERAPTAPAAPAKLDVAALRQQAQGLFGTLPASVELPGQPATEARVLLGRTLYHDTRLSKAQDLSCASCHALDGFGVDTRAEAVERGTSFGHKKQFGDRNAPSVFNAALHLAQFWDGRAADVEAQAKGPVLNPVEMAMADEASVVGVIRSIPGYAPLFAAAFPGQTEPITYDNMASAIGAFERQLVTPAPFDRWLRGEDGALSADQRDGLATFVSRGCIACHNGPGLGGGLYQKLGLLKPYPTRDEGRFKITAQESDRFFFKVPSLRNAAHTAPYFHDGSVRTLDQAVRIMAEYQTAGGPVSDLEVAHLVSFVESLTGTPPARLLAKPELPPSGPGTPAPDPS